MSLNISMTDPVCQLVRQGDCEAFTVAVTQQIGAAVLSALAVKAIELGFHYLGCNYEHRRSYVDGSQAPLNASLEEYQRYLQTELFKGVDKRAIQHVPELLFLNRTIFGPLEDARPVLEGHRASFKKEWEEGAIPKIKNICEIAFQDIQNSCKKGIGAFIDCTFKFTGLIQEKVYGNVF